MKILFDQGTPVPLRHHLPRHAVETAYEKGWSDLKNGDLLARAEAEGLDALITTDQNLRHQQNLAGRRVNVVVLMTSSWPRIREHTALVVQALDTSRPGGYEEVAFP
jgi:predicted nuclease of predicted toxin-antitoxin system